MTIESVDGKLGVRLIPNGPIVTETQPISEWYRLTYAGFTNDKCCPQGGCFGEISMGATIGDVMIPPEYNLTVKYAICSKCGFQLVKTLIKGKRSVYKVGG